ncbi:MAG: enoyl-CoA hydratase-related protein [Pseudomonadota bacterium]
MMAEEVLTKKVEDFVALLTLNRPGQANSLSRALFLAIRQEMEELEYDDNVRVILMTGAGRKAFCAGVDLKERAKMAKSDILSDREKVVKPCFDAIREVTKPIIAAVNGVALGGGAELALACDIRVASENARFGQTEIKWGMMPACGGCQRLRMIVGPGMAKEIVLTGRIMEAEEALRLGIYNRVVSEDDLMEEAKKLALEIAQNSPIAVRQAKRAIDIGAHLSESFDFEFEVSKACYSAGEAMTGPQKFKSP